ncbi:DEAD-box ATP-dependent RNA helicase 1 isoform X2 [Phalaenopsis equestris]|uniref:DEAD-box ATP-dependent RNA helicase 1 isoform X2 n=1 Tax=Phalaenopsis equestris TaxID=78828 RepID=UPI0009E3AA44|nr:DEAD-box ATP-dependent RNA helicase 1 isoform X2 [Phalaenopsis equestris]
MLPEKPIGKESMADSQHKTVPVLPWMRNPVDIEVFDDCPLGLVPRLDPRLVEALRKMDIQSLFPVQVAMWQETIGPGAFERDICVNSPTGSGKTLAYALPIVQILSTRKIRCLRALVVLPTRDLAIQVKEVFAAIAPAVGLSVGVAVGQSSIADEVSKLVEQPRLDTFSAFDPEDWPPELQSSVDILIATPGRLMDHINTTKGFSLEHLCYLVVDETDRLLREAYQSWLPTVIQLACMKSLAGYKEDVIFPSMFNSLTTIRRTGVERGFKGKSYPRLVKMIMSATLTQDPSKLSQLDLHHPLLLTSGDRRYKLPEKLESYKLICESKLKPLYLVALLQDLRGEKSIVFTSSVESTHRLSKLLNLFGELPCKVSEYSSLQHQSVRSKRLKAFREGKIEVLIASDAMTRGMDVEGVRNVINYDMPTYVKAFVHRAGRTARAGNKGRCFTLLRKDETKRFRKILSKAGKMVCNAHVLPANSIERLRPVYSTALEKLKQYVDSRKGKKHGIRFKSAEADVK